ncbi:MAG TPA: hypothetical protein VEB00_12230 [Clostridia bacterium]|nr:hypothetical protein [Clostridia bacterium]
MKRILIVIFALLLAVPLASCSFDSLGDYKKAVEKTEQIKKGQTSGEFSIVVDFKTEGMTEDEIKEINYFKDMKGSFNAALDEDAGKGIIRSYLNFGGLGFDFDLFMNGKEVFMKLPIVGKYIRLDEMQTQMIAEQQADGEQEFISKETLDELNAKWLGMLTKEDIFKGKDIVLTTPDGEVKTTEYTIKLNDEQIKKLASDTMDILSKDEKLKDNYEERIKKNIEPLKDTSFEKLFSDMKENMKDYTSEGFSYTAYVDIDGYIVNEIIEFAPKFKDAEMPVSMVSYRLDIKNWDINKEQKFDFPVLTEENTFDMDQMEQTMPFMMEDLFNNKN